MNEQEHELEHQHELLGETVLDFPVEQVESEFEDKDTFPHRFDVGEEVIYDEERYIISQVDESRSSPYRLLAGSDRGGRIVWAREKDLERMERYIEVKHDTGQAEGWE